MQQVRDLGIDQKVCILVGVGPLRSDKAAEFMRTRVPGVVIPDEIVARLENEVTVKRYKQDGSVVWLLPENRDFEPLRVDLKHESLIIEGVVVGVVRQEAGRA